MDRLEYPHENGDPLLGVSLERREAFVNHLEKVWTEKRGLTNYEVFNIAIEFAESTNEVAMFSSIIQHNDTMREFLAKQHNPALKTTGLVN